MSEKWSVEITLDVQCYTCNERLRVQREGRIRSLDPVKWIESLGWKVEKDDRVYCATCVKKGRV